jgi:LysM repeat protein
MSAFEFYLRTGRRVPSSDPNLELKFNPWHDPDDGRFTFAGQGRYFGGSGARTELQSPHAFLAGEANRGSQHAARSRSSQRQNSAKFHRFDPRNPANYSTYAVRRGDTLTSIAARRKGLTVADLAWLNGVQPSDTLGIGQQLKLPEQTYLDAGRAAKNNFVALAHYIETHGGLPANVAHAPLLPSQVSSSSLAREVRNGYYFEIDADKRTRHVNGEITLQSQPRSRSAQTNAGKPDRRASDDGGHYIAARFNGPREWFNHFAQDANFNRGAYRALEDRWARLVRSGKRVFVDIVPDYRGSSIRPYLLTVSWIVDGEEHLHDFPNERSRGSGGQ